jgi:glucose 1-dehydrogenase
MRLANRVALVTGANGGIGRGIAAAFAAEGAHVAVNYLPGGSRQQEAEEAAREFGGNAIAIAGDVSKREDVERMVAEVAAKLGRLDITVNNAGIEIRRPFLEVTDEEWNLVLNVNLYGAFLVCQIAARQMVKQGGGGKIINISSVHEDIAFPQYAPYCASKGGLRMLTRNIAIELAPHRINVNNIAPGAIATPINKVLLADPVASAEMTNLIPWGRFGKPEDVAGLAVYLAGSESDYVTGATFYIDGGLTQQITKH